MSRLGRSPPPRSWPFPADPRGVPGATVPRSLAIAGTSSPGLASSPEIQPLSPAHRAHAVGASLGVSPSIATSMRRVHLAAGFPALPMFRPQRFARSRRLPPLHTLPACFIRLPRPRFPLQGLFPLVSPPGSSPAGAFLPFAALACVRVAPRAPAPTTSTSRLRSDHRFVVARPPVKADCDPFPS